MYNIDTMSISKAQWDTDGDNLRLSMPFGKVDKERRIVSGFATLDNVDKQMDIVTTEASLKAFAKFRGNIREMHQPISVGKMVAFKEEKYFDPETKKFYTGVYVSVYVSKGAQDTWEKVLDGTLSGFSIGGRMNKWDDAYDEKADSTIRIIKEYDLVELSLVDNPANQFANILSVQKVDGADVISGPATEVVTENVFWDSESGIVVLSNEDSASSPVSGKSMQNIGFVEKDDNEKQDMIKFLVDSAKGINTEITKEVSPMTDENTAPVDETVVEKSDTEVAPEADAVIDATDSVEKADDAEVTKSNDMDEDDANGDSDPNEEEDAMKSDDMDEDEMKTEKSDLTEVSKSDDVATAVADIKDGITSAFSDLTAVVKSLNDEIAELKKSLSHMSAKIEDAEKGFNDLGKRVDAVETDTAFRKSGDLGEIVQEEAQIEKSEQSLWGGRFLKTADLFR